MIPTTDLRLAVRTGLDVDPSPRNLRAARPSLREIAEAAREYHFYGDEERIRKLFPPLDPNSKLRSLDF